MMVIRSVNALLLHVRFYNDCSMYIKHIRMKKMCA